MATLQNNPINPAAGLGQLSVLRTYPFLYFSQSGTILNQSGIGHNLSKLSAWPVGWYEIDGYKEHFSRDGQQESVRYFMGPWSGEPAFKDYVLGYSTNLQGSALSTLPSIGQVINVSSGTTNTTVTLAGPVNLQVGGSIQISNVLGATQANGVFVIQSAISSNVFTIATQPTSAYISGGTVIASTPGVLTRQIPIQHPRYPWQYAVDFRLIKGLGAWINDPFVFAQDPTGNLLGQTVDLSTSPGNTLQQQATIPYGLTPGGGLNPLSNPPMNSIPMIAYVQRTSQPAPQEWDDGVALVEIVFRPMPMAILTDNDPLVQANGEIARYVERSRTRALQAQLIPSTVTLQFSPGTPFAGTTVPGNPILLLPTATWKYVWWELPDINYGALAAVEGYVNDAPFDGLQGFPLAPTDTLLCHPVQLIRYWSTAGRWQWRMEILMDFRPNGWNSALATDGNFYPYQVTGGGLMYKRASFRSIFTMPQPGF